jgi:hypothetical protein
MAHNVLIRDAKKARMKVFLSSVITGFESFRDAAADAITSLGHVPVRAEDFGARIGTPQQACLSELRTCDLVVLILSDRYGAKQQGSGISATHEEFREARGTKPMLAFIRESVDREAMQDALITEVQDWAAGGITAAFRSQDELRRAVVKAIHAFELSGREQSIDTTEMQARALEFIRGTRNAQSGQLVVGAAPGPSMQLVPSAEFDASAMAEDVFDVGVARGLFTKMGGANTSRERSHLSVTQGLASMCLSQTGEIAVVTGAFFEDGNRSALRAIVEEDIRDKLESSLHMIAELLDSMDPTMRSTHVALLAVLLDSGWAPWRTRAEFARTGGSGTVGSGSNSIVVWPPVLAMRRAAVRHDAQRLAVELTALLRREVRRAG